MANTVNDVMNVIANPDYGIKNIAGTNQEILAIMQGTHNSKNNIYSLVNDVKNLLQELVGTSTKNKPVEVNGTSTKINQRHIQDILDETKGIRKAIDNLSKALLKQVKPNMPAVAKLSDKASEIVANAMVKSIDKNKGGGLSSIIDAFGKLKNISLKDIIFGKIKMNILTKIFNDINKDLKIKKKDLNNIIKLINAAPEIVKSLIKISLDVHIVAKSNVIKKLSEILTGENNSLLSLSNLLNMNKKEFSSAAKSAKNVSELVGGLFKATMLLSIIVVTGDIANRGVTLLDEIIDKLIPTINKLLVNDKQIKKSAKSARSLKAFAGQMALTSLILATIAATGIPALLGSWFMSEIVKLCSETFKLLAKAKKNVLIGSAAIVLMGTSLILFGIALGKITNATKGVGFKQVGVIAALTVLLGGSIALLGIPAVFPFIALGSISMAIMSVALIPYGIALNKLSKASKNLKMKNILKIAGSMIPLGLIIAAMAPLTIPISLGSIAVKKITNIVNKFINTLEKIKKLGTVPTKLVYQTLNSMGAIGNFFRHNMLKKKAIKNAKRYQKILRPFGNTIKHLSKLKELGVIPMKLVYQTLGVIKNIADYYIENPIEKDVIKQAKMYKKILRPFGKTLTYLTKLKELGVIPMKLVYQTLNAMHEISNYYIENPIKKRAIKQAKRYKDILKPFGKTIKQLVKLKELGTLPMKLVYQTLNTIGYIANYYIENPIKKRAIKQAKRYKDILKPFGKTITYLLKLKEIKSIPLKLVHQVLNAMSVISDFYKQQDVGSENNALSISLVISSFAKSVESLKSLSDLKGTPLNAINNIIEGVNNLSNINPNNISNIGYTISNALSGINTIDMDKVQSVTNMFSAFNGINKSENVINKFTESVKEFTNTCKNLMDAMSDNTNAINNIDNSGEKMVFSEIRENNIIESGGSNKTINDGVRIANVEEIAKTIAEKINGALSVDISDTQVQLLINGIGGNEWTITRY